MTIIRNNEKEVVSHAHVVPIRSQ